MPSCQEPGPLTALRGTVKPFGRHVLVCTGDASWPTRIEDADGLVGAIARDVNALAGDVAQPPKATALATPPTTPGTVDMLVYPDAVAYRGLGPDAWARVRDEHLREGRVVGDLGPEPLDGWDVLTCTHMERDARCGNCGPLVAAAVERAFAARGVPAERARVHRTSHVGGHAFAGNVIVYPGGAWYGYVRPQDADVLVDAVVAGRVWDEHLRGVSAEPAP